MPAVSRQISPHAHRLRREMTDVERKLWSIARNRQIGGFKFRRQHTIGDFIVDFVCLEAQLIVELDGGQHDAEADAQRTAFLEARGYRVIRFWNNQVNESFEGVYDTILAALLEGSKGEEGRRPSPNPLPEAGES